MDEYIKREALRNAVKENSFTKYDWSEEIDVEDFEKVLDKIPAEDVAPVVHGRWEYKRCVISDFTIDLYRCSECNTAWNADSNYCPNCGAKMDLK